MSVHHYTYCETWPACDCFVACEDEPRAGWAVPFVCILCIAVWAVILGGLWLLLAPTA